MTSPIVLKQRRLYGVDNPLMLAHSIRRVMRQSRPVPFGFFGATQVGAPVGQGAASGAATGASQGAAGGAVAGPIGMAIGAIVGAIGGAIAGSINKKDPEQYNFDQAVALWQQNPDLVYQIGNKYLPLAGLFDLNIKTNIPIYKRYGHMGEQKFTTDFVNLIYTAAQQGQITASDTPVTVMSRVVQPWIDSWGFGPMADPHADLINRLLIGMIADYVSGAWKNSWFAIGGDFPFGSLPMFTLPGSASTSSTATAPSAPVTISPSGAVSTIPTITPAATATTQVFSADGSTLTVGQTAQNVALQDAQGNKFQFGVGNSAGVAPVYVNSTPVPNGTAYSILLSGGIAYLKPKPSTWGDGSLTFAYQNGAWVQSADPRAAGSVTTAPTSSTPVATTTAISSVSPSTTTVAIPAGYQMVGTANGLPAYQGLDGTLYSWSGTTMTPLTGTLTTSTGQTVPVNVGQIQQTMTTPSLTSGSQQLFNTATAPSMPAPTPSTSAPTSSPAPAAAGVTGAGLPSWMTWGAVAAVVGLLFATARPASQRGTSHGAH